MTEIIGPFNIETIGDSPHAEKKTFYPEKL